MKYRIIARNSRKYPFSLQRGEIYYKRHWFKIKEYTS